jgi:hypothetical protein
MATECTVKNTATGRYHGVAKAIARWLCSFSSSRLSSLALPFHAEVPLRLRTSWTINWSRFTQFLLCSTVQYQEHDLSFYKVHAAVGLTCKLNLQSFNLLRFGLDHAYSRLSYFLFFETKAKKTLPYHQVKPEEKSSGEKLGWKIWAFAFCIISSFCTVLSRTCCLRSLMNQKKQSAGDVASEWRLGSTYGVVCESESCTYITDISRQYRSWHGGDRPTREQKFLAQNQHHSLSSGLSSQ